VTRSIQTSGPPGQTEAATQTIVHDAAGLLTSARGAAVWIAGQFLADKILSPQDVVAFLPSLTSLEAEVMIIAVGEGMGAANRAAASAKAIPVSLARNVCLLAEHDEPGFATSPVVVPPLPAEPAFVAPTPPAIDCGRRQGGSPSSKNTERTSSTHRNGPRDGKALSVAVVQRKGHRSSTAAC
jgi:hypothetical protein